jgi:anaerobic selenocysteine-containing dehydrogenase
VTYEELQKKVYIQPRFQYRKYEKGMFRRDGQPGFETNSGKIELSCSIYEAFGDDALPYYKEHSFGVNSDYFKEYPLILTTGARNYASFHSEHRQIDVLRELVPGPIVEMHPKTAAEYGIIDGDIVVIENMFGYCKQKARLTPILKPGVVAAAHGWWFPEQDGEEPNLFGTWKANINNLMPHKEIGKLGFGAPYKSMICKIQKAKD